MDLDDYGESDDTGSYLEMCFPGEMAPIILDEQPSNEMKDEDLATLRVYVAQSIKRAIVMKENHIWSKKEIGAHSVEVTKASVAEIHTWLLNQCFVL